MPRKHPDRLSPSAQPAALADILPEVLPAAPATPELAPISPAPPTPPMTDDNNRTSPSAWRRPGDPTPGYGGVTVVLDEETRACLRDHGNTRGLTAHFEFAEGAKPEKEVMEQILAPLKEPRENRNRFHWSAGVWKKQVAKNPIAERLDAEDRFDSAVERLKAYRNQQKERQR